MKSWEKEFDKKWVASNSKGFWILDPHFTSNPRNATCYVLDVNKVKAFIAKREKELLEEVIEIVASYNPPDSVLKKLKELSNE